MKLIYFGVIIDGVLKLHGRKSFEQEIQRSKWKEVMITVERKVKQRSSPQNRYYWGCIVPIVKQGLTDLGHEVDLNDTHEFLKATFNYKEIVNQESGEVYRLPKSSTELTTSGFMEFKDKIQRWGSEFLGVNIPDPNEQIEIEVPDGCFTKAYYQK